MSYCPSQDWDRYCDQQDEAAAQEVAWWKENGDRVLRVVCAKLAAERRPIADQPSVEELVGECEQYVRAITAREADPY